MESTVNGVTYQAAPEVNKEECTGCVAYGNADLCNEVSRGIDCYDRRVIWVEKVGDKKPAPAISASTVLNIAADTIDNRASERDAEQERSMARCVNAFNAMTGHKLSEEDGWMFMQYLKQSRSRAGNYRFDDYLDEVAYAALRAECAANGKIQCPK